MRVFVKICGFRHAEQVTAAITAGADAIGFVFADSVRRVSVQTAQDIAEHIPSTVLRVAVMRHPANDEWAAVRDVFAPDVLQTDLEDFAGLDVPGDVICWPVLRQGGAAQGKDQPGAYIYESKHSGKGELVDWSQAAHVALDSRMILAGGLSPANVAAAIQSVRPYGVDVSSGVESQPGEKDPELIRQFISAVRAAENNL
jgi:phosphoribosylanthranilate isomerase